MRTKTTLTLFILLICAYSTTGQTLKFSGLYADDPEGIHGLYNPERGFRLEVTLDVTHARSMWNPDQYPDITSYLEKQADEYASDNVSLVQSYFYLTGAIGRELTEEEFGTMNIFFDALRRMGKKAVLRFAYETDHMGRATSGPTLDDVAVHTKQLRTILRENKDVIAVIQAGFIGAWGEWHNSFHGLEKSEETKRTILQHICAMTPNDRMIQVRMPAYKNLLHPDSGCYHRVSFHDDLILTDEHPWNEGMQEGAPSYNQIVEESPYLMVDGELPWGEWSMQKDPDSPNSGFLVDGLKTARKLFLQHFTSLSIVHNYKEYGAPDKYSMMYWKETPVTPGFLRKNRMPFSPAYFKTKDGKNVERNVFDYIRDHLGYRIELQKLKTKKQWDYTKKNRIELSLVNRGFSTLFNDHPVYFVLIDENGHVCQRIRTRTDVMEWQPYRPNDEFYTPLTHTIKADVQMEGMVEKGTYKLGLWIPDGSEELMFNSRFAIRCANSDVDWWISPDRKYGVNILTTVTF